MVNVFEDAFSTLRDEMQANAGVTVTIGNGTHETEVTAVQGVTNHTTEDVGSGLRVATRIDDFHIAIADYAFNGIAAEPMEGHTIEYTRGSVTRKFVVVSPPGLGCYTLVDADTAYRIHTVNERNVET